MWRCQPICAPQTADMLMVKIEIMARVIMLKLLTTVGDDDDDNDHAHHHDDCHEEMMLTTLGSPPWVATCSKGAGAAAFGKKMLIRLPISLTICIFKRSAKGHRLLSISVSQIFRGKWEIFVVSMNSKVVQIIGGQLWQRLVVAVCPKLFEQTLLSLSVASNAEVMGYLYKRSAVMEIQESEKEENYKSRIEI